MTIRSNARFALTIAGLLLAPGFAFAQSGTATPPHVPLQKTIGHWGYGGYYNYPYADPCVVWNGYDWVNACY